MTWLAMLFAWLPVVVDDPVLLALWLVLLGFAVMRLACSPTVEPRLGSADGNH
jgi:hypothetical protein